MTESSYIEISEIMDSFDLDEVQRLIHDQIEMLDEDTCENMIDNFKILYTKYASIQENQDQMDEDDYNYTVARFYKICELFIEEVCDKYNISINEEYLNDHYGDIPRLALCLYRFFVIDFKGNLYHVLLTYIQENMEQIAQAFESAKLKRDASTLVNKKIEDSNVGLVVSNIYDIADWVIEQLDEDTYMDFVGQDYLLLDTLKDLFDKDIIVGDFTTVILEILQTNIAMKGRVCFDLICKFKGVI